MTKQRIVMLLLCGCALSAGCTKSDSAKAPPSASKALTRAAPATEPGLQPPPQPAEVREKIAGIYRESVVVDGGTAVRSMTGDFNGDSSPDLAVVVRPASGKLDLINSELAAWLVKDPRSVAPPMPKTTPHAMRLRPRSVPVRVEAHDLLLAVIHGYGSTGWRNSAARQAYLLRNVAGRGMELESLPVALDRLKQARRWAPLQGDVVKLQRAGEEGLLYWTEGKYAWCSLR